MVCDFVVSYQTKKLLLGRASDCTVARQKNSTWWTSPTLRFLQLYDFPTLRFSNFTIQWHARPYQGFHRRTLPLTLTLVICCYFLESFIPIIHCHLNRYLKRAPLHPRGKLLRVQALRHPAIHHRRSCLHLPTGSELRRLAAGRCRGAKG